MYLRQTTKCTICMWLEHMGFSGGKLNHYAGNRNSNSNNNNKKYYEVVNKN